MFDNDIILTFGFPDNLSLSLSRNVLVESTFGRSRFTEDVGALFLRRGGIVGLNSLRL